MLLSLSGTEKDQDLIVTLNITDLLAVPKVANHNFYSDTESWKTLSVEFNNKPLNQKKNVPFKIYDGESSLQETVQFSGYFEGAVARFERIVIYDKGNGHLIIGRDDVSNPSQYDFPIVNDLLPAPANIILSRFDASTLRVAFDSVVGNTQGYQINLYNENDVLVDSIKTPNTEHDFSNSATTLDHYATVASYTLAGATDLEGVSAQSNTLQGIDVPSVPTGLSALHEDDVRTISWDDMPDADSYILGVSDTIDGTYDEEEIFGTSKVYTNVPANDVKYYKVRSKNISGESADSSALATNSEPAIPTGLDVSYNNNDRTVSWDSMAGATSYILGVCDTVDGAYIPTEVFDNQYQDIAIEGETKFYKVLSKNASGESEYSSVVESQAPYITAPDAPANLQSSFVEDGNHFNITLTWDQEAGHEYEVYLNSMLINGLASSPFYHETSDGLQEFTVRAKNVTSGLYSSFSSTEEDLEFTPPIAPENFSASYIENGPDYDIEIVWDMLPNVTYELYEDATSLSANATSPYIHTVNTTGMKNFSIRATSTENGTIGTEAYTSVEVIASYDDLEVTPYNVPVVAGQPAIAIASIDAGSGSYSLGCDNPNFTLSIVGNEVFAECPTADEDGLVTVTDTITTQTFPFGIGSIA